MKIVIATSDDGQNIGVVKHYIDILDKSMITQFLMELEIIKKELVELYEIWCDSEEEGVDV